MSRFLRKFSSSQLCPGFNGRPDVNGLTSALLGGVALNDVAKKSKRV